MTDKPKDTLLTFGKIFVLILQGICAVAGVVMLLLIPIVILTSQGMMTEFFEPGETPDFAKQPSLSVVLSLLLTAFATTMFFFFGKMRAIIKSVGEGDAFIPVNAQRLNMMAWLLLAVEILTVLIGAMRAHLAEAMGWPMTGSSFRIYDLDGLLMVITLFILARVFKHGAAMREDLEGTV